MKLWIDTGRVAGALTLFGLPSVERIRRSAGRPIPVKGSGNPPIPVETTLSGPGAAATPWPGARVDASSLPLGARLRAALAAADAPLVAVDGADVVDPRLVTVLGRPGPSSVASRGDGAHRAVALRLDPALAEAIPERAASLVEVADALLGAGRAVPFDESAFPAYVDKLRRSLPYWLYAIPDRATQARLEHRMFWDNYKGSTDFLTRWVYPPLVWPMVRLCTRLRIHPNAVTMLSIVLAFAAVPLFAAGEWVWGFASAYGMSVLDSVDGKVARLTLTDSWIGNLLDHGLDLVHPPFWYFAWAWGLGAREFDDPLYQAGVWLIVFYVADRLVLRVAKQRLRFALHAATPLDGRVRSFIARRNITMTIMAAALAVGAGAAGLWIVTAWQGLTFAWHGLRTLQLGYLAAERPRPGA